MPANRPWNTWAITAVIVIIAVVLALLTTCCPWQDLFGEDGGIDVTKKTVAGNGGFF